MAITPAVVRELIRRELPLVTTFLLKKSKSMMMIFLQEHYEKDDISDISVKFFRDFKVQPACFTLASYFPRKNLSLFSRSPVKQDKKPLTIRMFTESARAGRGLF